MITTHLARQGRSSEASATSNRPATGQRRDLLAGLLAVAAISIAGCHAKPASTSVAGPNPSAAATLSTPEARKAAKQPFTTPPAVKRNLYPPVDQAAADIAAAEKQAAREHKRVLLDFGGDWCGDCQVLDIYFHQQPNADLLREGFVKVNVNIGHEDANVELAQKFGVPLKGVPALAVVAPDGKVLCAQDQQFSDMRYMEPSSVTAFLTKWKPA